MVQRLPKASDRSRAPGLDWAGLASDVIIAAPFFAALLAVVALFFGAIFQARTM